MSQKSAASCLEVDLGRNPCVGHGIGHTVAEKFNKVWNLNKLITN